MKTATDQLKAFLVSTQTVVKPTLLTITQPGGATRRFTDADVSVKVGGYTFAPYPGLRDSGVKQSRGVTVDTVQITFTADERHTIDGVPLLRFIRKNGLEGAVIRLERAYAASWEALKAEGPVGVVTRFHGRFSEVLDGGRTEATVQVASWTEVLNRKVPSDVFSASCGNTLFDSRCGVDRADYAATGAVGSGDTSETEFDTDLTAAAGYFDQGAIIFTSGPNTGQRRSIRSQGADGLIKLTLPLPAPPQPGDGFTAYPGCDLSKGLGGCAKFNNLARFRGQPFIPVPETAV